MVGVDASVRMVDHANELLELPANKCLRGRVHFEQHDVCKLPYEGNFDVATTWNAMHWVVDRCNGHLVACDRFSAALKPGGRLFMCFHGEGMALSAAVVARAHRHVFVLCTMGVFL